jgi:hypothetical protein
LQAAEIQFNYYEWRANGTITSSNSATTYDPPGLVATTTYTRFAKDNNVTLPYTIYWKLIVTVYPNFTAGEINNGKPFVIMVIPFHRNKLLP